MGAIGSSERFGRLRDMVPNVMGIAVAAAAIFVVRKFRRAGLASGTREN